MRSGSPLRHLCRHSGAGRTEYVARRTPGGRLRRGERSESSSGDSARLSRVRRACLALWASGFEPLPRPELLLLACPRRSNQEEGHPARRPAVAFATSGCVEGWPGFLTGHPCPDQKGGGVLPPPAARPDRPALTAAKGTRESKSKVKSRAERRGFRRLLWRWRSSRLGTSLRLLPSGEKAG